MTHTPGPWIASHKAISAPNQHDPTRRAAKPLAVCQRPEDAAYIVHLEHTHAALLEALKAMVKMSPDCLNDILNPCWDAARSTKQEYGKHWGGGQACAVCISKQAITQTEAGA